MPEEPKTENVAEKVALMKKSGLSTVATIVILLMSTPGFYEFFLNRTDDEALRQAKESQAKAVESITKVEVAYEVLRASVESRSHEVETLREEVSDLRRFLREYLAHAEAVPMHVETISSPAHRGVARARGGAGMGAGVGGGASPAVGFSLDASALDDPAPPDEEEELPESLDDAVDLASME